MDVRPLSPHPISKTLWPIRWRRPRLQHSNDNRDPLRRPRCNRRPPSCGENQEVMRYHVGEPCKVPHSDWQRNDLQDLPASWLATRFKIPHAPREENIQWPVSRHSCHQSEANLCRTFGAALARACAGQGIRTCIGLDAATDRALAAVCVRRHPTPLSRWSSQLERHSRGSSPAPAATMSYPRPRGRTTEGRHGGQFCQPVLREPGMRQAPARDCPQVRLCNERELGDQRGITLVHEPRQRPVRTRGFGAERTDQGPPVDLRNMVLGQTSITRPPAGGIAKRP